MSLLLLTALLFPAPQKGAPVELELPWGYDVDLIAEAPDVRQPIAIYCLDDGSLLVTEQARPVGRMLHLGFESDGTCRIDVFADGLGSVRALEQIDDCVLVVNGPQLTRLADRDADGRADEREVIIDGLGRAVAGMTMALDGFLYLSVEDEGIPLATGRDGSTLTLRGGGVVRLRPDGTRLEVIATGMHRQRIVAIDERGEMFAFDDLDDGWHPRTRLVHVIDGGSYGYPWELRDRPERALPCVSEYGDVAPRGGLVYTSDSWPRPYQGNLFWCEWERQVVRRLEVEPDGATYRVFGEHDFVSKGGVEDFRPVDVCLSADGRCLYLADSADEVGGRVWRVRLRGDRSGRRWSMRPLPRDQGALVDALADPSLRRRLRAQRAVVDLGANESLIDILIKNATANPNEHKRRHALWALAELDRLAARDAAIVSFGLTEDSQVQALRAFGRHARRPAAEMVPLLSRGTPRVRREAATTLGRIGGRDAAVRLAAAHGLEDDPLVRWSIRRALARIGVWNTDVVNWMHLSADPEAELLLSMHEVFDVDAVAILSAFVSGEGGSFPDGWGERLGPQRARALAILSELHRLPEPWDGTWWGERPWARPSPPKVIEWEGSAAVVAAVRAALGDPTAAVRRAALGAVRTMPDLGALPAVRARYADETEEELRLAILDVVAALQDGSAADLLGSIVRDDSASAALQEGAIRAAGAIATDETKDLLLDVARRAAVAPSAQAECLRVLGESRVRDARSYLEAGLANPRASIRAAAARALARVAGVAAVPHLTPLLEDHSAEVQLEVIDVLADHDARAAIPALLARLDDPDVSAQVLAALTRMPDPRALDALLDGLEHETAGPACRRALRHLRDEIRPELESRHRAGELDARQVEELRSVLIEPVPILDWTIFGPFEAGAGEPPFSARTARFETAGLLYRAALEHGKVDLVDSFPLDRDVEIYGVAELVVPEARQVELAVGSDGGLTVWVAGVQVHSFDGPRRWSADQDRILVELAAGANQVVVRSFLTRAGGRFSVAVSGVEGGPFFGELFEGDKAPELEAYRAACLEGGGDASRGFQLLRDGSRLNCLRCRTLSTPRGRLGDRVGPDLDGVADRHDRAALIESLLEPSRRVAVDYRAETIRLIDGTVLLGQVRAERDGRLRLVDSSGEPREIPLDEIADRRPSRQSVMPVGLHERLSLEGLTDLVAFLETLGERPGREEGREQTEERR